MMAWCERVSTRLIDPVESGPADGVLARRSRKRAVNCDLCAAASREYVGENDSCEQELGVCHPSRGRLPW